MRCSCKRLLTMKRGLLVAVLTTSPTNRHRFNQDFFFGRFIRKSLERGLARFLDRPPVLSCAGPGAMLISGYFYRGHASRWTHRDGFGSGIVDFFFFFYSGYETTRATVGHLVVEPLFAVPLFSNKPIVGSCFRYGSIWSQRDCDAQVRPVQDPDWQCCQASNGRSRDLF